MKVFALLVLLAAVTFTGSGCATPAYSASERHAQIRRNMNYEFLQITDDWDHLMLFRPAGHMTIWNIQ